jgi:hypothetical protein
MRLAEAADDEMLDVETSAAVLRWMEIALVPDGIVPEEWERWVKGGCRGSLELDGALVTPAMLGRWARTGILK